VSTQSTRLAEAAQLLHDASRSRTDFTPDPDVPESRCGSGVSVQRLILARYIDGGAVLRGHKIGLTCAPMQQLLGVNEPDFGYILDSMVLPNGAAVPVTAFCAPRVEPEAAFLMRAPLRRPGVTAEDVLAATQALASALEIVDSRIANWRITLADTIADNASSEAVVLGQWVPISQARSLPDTTATLVVNDTTAGSGHGTAVMGDPAAAVAWLANALAQFGTGVEAGQFVMSGSYTAAVFVVAGDAASAAISGLGTVCVSFQ